MLSEHPQRDHYDHKVIKEPLTLDQKDRKDHYSKVRVETKVRQDQQVKMVQKVIKDLQVPRDQKD